MIKDYKYSYRLVAFLDILGFKELIKANKLLSHEILKMLYAIRGSDTSFKIEKAPHPTGYHIQIYPDIMSFSDHIIISYPIIENEALPIQSFYYAAINNLYHIIAAFYRYALPLGILLRGAISAGEIYCDKTNNIIFGDALIEAIETEAALAIYPRVVASKKIRSLFESDIIQNEALPWCRRDFDGMFYMDYFNALFIDQRTEESVEIARKIRTHISNNINLYKNNIKILSKWQWLANYYDQQLKIWKLNYEGYVLLEEFDLLKNNFENLRAGHLQTNQ